MGIWDRLGGVIKSYLNDGTGTIFNKSGNHGGFSGNTRDSDLNAAYEELDDFLRGEEKAPKEPPKRRVPDEIRADFAELGLSPQASPEECKAVYKKLLKKHHPDRHAADSEALKKATEKTARVNTAYKRILEWQKV